MNKLTKKVDKLVSNSEMAVLSLSLNSLSKWGEGCLMFFYEPKEPEAMKDINLKELCKELK